MPWVVAIASPGQGARALKHLKRASLEYFCPMVRTHRYHHGRRIERDGWLFGRYVFVNVVDRWHELETTIGVQGLIRIGEAIATLPDAIVASIRARCDRHGFYVPKQPGRFRRGQRVRIGHGPYANSIAIYQSMRPNDRANALVQFMGAWVHADVGEGDLAAA